MKLPDGCRPAVPSRGRPIRALITELTVAGRTGIGSIAMTVAAILRQKGRDVASVSPNTNIADVTRMLAERRIGAVMVCDAAAQILGILSERDIVRSLAQDGAATLAMTAAQLMSSPVHTANLGTSVSAAMALMTQRRVRHLPVLDADKELAGLVSIGDVVKALIDQQALEVDSLKAYVAGAG